MWRSSVSLEVMPGARVRMQAENSPSKAAGPVRALLSPKAQGDATCTNFSKFRHEPMRLPAWRVQGLAPIVVTIHFAPEKGCRTSTVPQHSPQPLPMAAQAHPKASEQRSVETQQCVPLPSQHPQEICFFPNNPTNPY